MHFLLTTVVLLAVHRQRSSQQWPSKWQRSKIKFTFSCNAWKNNNGYCTNTAQSMDMRKRYCGVACGFCNTDGTQTAAGGGSTLTACEDANANCASWVTSKNFCARPDYSNSMKLLYCCKTCRPIIFAPSTVLPTTGSAPAASTPAASTPPPTPAAPGR